MREIHTWMFCFGALTPKPTRLIGTPRWISKLQKKFVRKQCLKKERLEIVKRYVDKKGRNRVVGGKHLKQTQKYPPGYGRAILKAFQNSRDNSHVKIDLQDLGSPLKQRDLWSDAKLKSLLLSLKGLGYLPPKGTILDSL